MEHAGRVTIKDIAKTVKLPAATVKYALNDLPGLKKTVKLQILSAAKRLGYQDKTHIKSSNRVTVYDPGVGVNAKGIVMADIAEFLEVSISTVSRALNGSAAVSAQTRKLVKKTAMDLGYVMNTDARDLRVKGLSAVVNNEGKVTMCDIADCLNLSVATVSRCFAPQGEVSAATKNLVLETARDMGYTLTDYARRLRLKKQAS